MITGIEHIALTAERPAELQCWYVEVFGFVPVAESGKPTNFIRAPGGMLLEFLPTNVEEDHGNSKGSGRFGGFDHLAFATTDIETTAEKLRLHQVTIVSKSAAAMNGTQHLFFLDPEGNKLQFVQRRTPL